MPAENDFYFCKLPPGWYEMKKRRDDYCCKRPTRYKMQTRDPERFDKIHKQVRKKIPQLQFLSLKVGLILKIPSFMINKVG
jgi:hypothetical protein